MPKRAERDFKKTLIIAYCEFPPVIAGPAVLMGNLFRHFPKGSYCVLMGRPEKFGRPIDPASTLDCRYFFCPVAKEKGRGVRGWLNLLLEFLLVPFIVMQGLRIIKTERVDNILVVPYMSIEISAFLLHKIAKKPLFVYLFDAYYVKGRFPNKINAFVARNFERKLLRTASAVFVMSEPLQEYYRLKYGLPIEMLPHPVDLSLYEGVSSRQGGDGFYRIVFTGIISRAQIGALRNLLEALNKLEEKKVKLILYTLSPPEELAHLGLAGEKVESGFAFREEIPAIQKSADILFLPLAFDTSYPDIIRTASPSKMPEYLAAGRPILVHAPFYSYISQYARQHGFGLVVDQPDPYLLKEAILQLLDNNDLQNRLIENAYKTSKRHDSIRVSEKLKGYLLH